MSSFGVGSSFSGSLLALWFGLLSVNGVLVGIGGPGRVGIEERGPVRGHLSGMFPGLGSSEYGGTGVLKDEDFRRGFRKDVYVERVQRIGLTSV